MWSRIYLIPLLQAEEDRDQVRRYYSAKEMEKELLGAETKVYNSDRYVYIARRVAACCVYEVKEIADFVSADS